MTPRIISDQITLSRSFSTRQTFIASLSFSLSFARSPAEPAVKSSIEFIYRDHVLFVLKVMILKQMFYR